MLITKARKQYHQIAFVQPRPMNVISEELIYSNLYGKNGELSRTSRRCLDSCAHQPGHRRSIRAYEPPS